VRGWEPEADEWEEWFDRGTELYELGKYEKAIASLDQAIKIKPDLHNAWSNRGHVLGNLGRYADAITSYDRAIEINPDNHEAYYARGIALDKLGRCEEAISSLDRAIEFKPDFHEAYYSRGIALGHLGRYEEAITSYERAIEINPDFQAWHNRGITLGHLGRHEEAIASYERAIEINPDFQAWHNRGGALYNLDRYEEAIASYDQAIEINPDYHDAWSNRGTALANLGRYEEAINSYNQAIEINPDLHQAWHNRGVMSGSLGRYEEAITSFDQATNIKPDYHKAWYNRATVLVNLKRYKEAIPIFDRAIEINPDDHEYWYNRGITLINLGQYEEAIKNYDQAIEIKPDLHEAWFNRGGALGNLERHKEAIDSFDRAIEINPDNHEYWYNRGFSLINLGRYDEAVNSYDQVSIIKPEYQEAWFNRGSALCKLGRHEEAIDSYDRAIEINSDDHKYWYNRCIALVNLGRYDEAVKNYDQAFQHIHRNTNPEGWGFLQHKIGQNHYNQGKNGENQVLNYWYFGNREIRYEQALSSYLCAYICYSNALSTLTREQSPKLRLETLIDAAKLRLAIGTSAAHKFQIEAVDILGDLLNAEPTFAGKERLQLEYSSLRQLDVDLFVASGDNIRALEIAERDKNNHLIWLLTALDEKIISPKYAQMQQLLTTASGDRKTGIVYWHLSPDHLTTFILHPHHPNPQVLTNSSHQLRNWLKDYDTDNLDTAKLAELGNILQISEINRHLDGIEHLILIPHRDLHRLPLHTYWQNLTTTYLPSIQIGLNLKAKPQPDRSAGFLLVESPSYQATTTEQKKGKALGLLPSVEIEVAVIKALFAPPNPIPRGKISTANLTAKLQQPHYYGHFNGHAYHNPRQPQNSSLILENDDELTCSDLSAIDLNPYHLITLSACQTGVTTHQTIDTEYVGIVSAFLSRGTNYVVSTLWSVEDLPSSLLMMTFYWYLKQGIPAPQALRKAANWLRNLTYAKEAEFYGNIATLIQPTNTTLLESIEDHIIAVNKENPAVKPYSSPYYWAAFTISGWG
jgi:tetratricopeptide (TPR) repeat protein